MLKRHWKSLLAFLAMVWTVEGISTGITMPAVESWYQLIAKPAWTPPDWVFGPVWGTLYIFIAVAGWRVWAQLSEQGVANWRHPALRAWGLQLGLNLTWSCLFFGAGLFGLALADIILLLVAILLTMYHAKPIDSVAYWLLAPYALWVAYASTLNAGIIWLNWG